MTLIEQRSAHTALQYFDSFPCDRQAISQERLDLAAKARSSLLPWRGQFSPELIEFFLEQYSESNSVVLDPFAGSGTTLFEAARKGLEAYGAEINPSAVELAATAHFVNLSATDRENAIQEARALVKRHMPPLQLELFDYQDYASANGNSQTSADVTEMFLLMLKRIEGQPFVRNLLVNSLIRYMNDRRQDGADSFLRAFDEHCKLVRSLPYSEQPCRALHCDARNINLPDNSVSLVITSPPYINVFNYHQNNRPAMELLGWDLLHVARSELGSNRKHRQNRFLTVIQYALDMAETLRAMRRLLNPDGRVILVVGRESCVRGVSFENGRLVAALAVGVAGFTLCNRQERKFKNKFGEVIYEDILHLSPATAMPGPSEETARAIAGRILEEATERADDPVRGEILAALERADTVKQSPIFNLHPNH